MASSMTNSAGKRRELVLLGAKIKELRAKRRLTQEALAEALDITVGYVSLIERGGRNPPYTTVLAIAKALGVPPARLVTDE